MLESGYLTPNDVSKASCRFEFEQQRVFSSASVVGLIKLTSLTSRMLRLELTQKHRVGWPLKQL